MSAYLHLFFTSFMELAAYPARIWGTFGVRLITLLGFFIVWQVIYQDQSTIGGYTFNQMMTYYALTVIITQLTRVWTVIEEMQDFIHRGTLSAWLLKPINISLTIFSRSTAYRFVYALAPSLTFTLAVLFFPQYILNTSHFLPFILSLILTIILAYLLYSSVGLIAFWVTQMTGIRQVFARLTEILTGSLFPLALLPVPVLMALKWLPFPYIYAAPISIYLGNNQLAISYLLMIQFAYCLILLALYRILWYHGIRRYESVGS